MKEDEEKEEEKLEEFAKPATVTMLGVLRIDKGVSTGDHTPYYMLCRDVNLNLYGVGLTCLTIYSESVEKMLSRMIPIEIPTPEELENGPN